MVDVQLDNDDTKSNLDMVVDFDLCIVSEREYSLEQLFILNMACRKNNTYFVSINSYGYFATMFQDLTDSYAYTTSSEEPIESKNGMEVEEDGEKQTVVQQHTASFVDYQTAWEASHQSLRRPARLLYGILALEAFQQQNDRTPDAESQADVEAVMDLCKTIMEDRKVKRGPKDLDQEFVINLVNGIGMEIAPVCAILGGIVAQEVIKVISHNDTPIQNLFLYDGLNGSGLVETLE
eukprot:TRINITY_DN6812_c0_g1_i2.p1 TRINITY_DN6812_c0_g1~~TRINITY_DN6812_c0_g1_i2.p1  ORF type:complete len:236 (+),score=82.45 TRINITY_DN6812_c0_g1_i2:405-1112(+)